MSVGRPAVHRLAALALVATLAWSATAGADCKSDLADWATVESTCELEVVRCFAGGAVVSVGGPGPSKLEVEIRRGGRPGFRAVRDISLSPLIQVDDWSKVAPERRAAFERLATCVDKNPRPWPSGEPSTARQAPPPPAAFTPPSPTLPWRLLLGVVLAATAIFAKPSKLAWKEIALACLGLPAASLLLWRVLYPSLFLHPDGQGPLWILYALQGPLGASPYGPGFSEMFGWVLI